MTKIKSTVPGVRRVGEATPTKKQSAKQKKIEKISGVPGRNKNF